MSKRSVFTSITPLPAHISRETAVALLHDHVEMIRMNPLVIRMEPSTPPPNATPEEAKVMCWYAITDEIVYVPGTKVKGETTYKAGFYNLPLGLQTHVFAPAGVDIKTKWSVGGSLPGEAKESVELGLNAPREGLYIREDADLRCSMFVMNFVKRNLKKGHLVLCERLIEKASLADKNRNTQLVPESVLSSDGESILRRWDHLYSPDMSEQRKDSSMSTPTMDNTCACEGVSHEPSCPNYMHSGQSKRASVATSRVLPPSTRQSTVDFLLEPHADQGQSGLDRTTSYSRAEPLPCSCTGGVHIGGCTQYSGSVVPRSRPRSTEPELGPQFSQRQQQPYQISLPVSMDEGPATAHPHSNPYSFSKPQLPSADILSTFSGHTFRPQRPGEQAELPATTEWRDDVGEVYSAIELKPDPLFIRTQHGHTVVMELDSQADLARQYWQQRIRDSSGMASG